MTLKIPPVIIFSISFLFCWVIQRYFPDYNFPFEYSYILSYIFCGMAFIIGILGIYEFKKHRTTVDPMKPEITIVIVQSGIYKYSRNPMYLGLAMCLLGMIIYYMNPVGLASLAFLVSYLTKYQIKPEERILEDKFGEDYKSYVNKVRRWL